MRLVRAADLFCGAGGTSTGLIEACAELGFKAELTAINHWDVAIATHTANHSDSRHLCAHLDGINPRELYKEGELDLLWASPECTHHSIARGGKPINDQSRATAWCVVRWAEALRPPIILVENVKEFQSWGTIGSDGRPLKSRKGEVFQSWINNLEALGYRVDWRVLCAADYGDPTTRERLFVYAVRGRRKIVWPEPSHAAIEVKDMFGSRKRWVPARDIIDWSLEGKSIFKRKKPLADKTLNRILIGLEKFGLKPFIFGAGGPSRAGEPTSVDNPLRTVLTRNHSYVANPYLVHLRGNCDAKDLNKPAPALTAGGGHLALAEPYLIQCNHEGSDSGRVRDTDRPLPTVAGNRGEWALCEPFVIGQQSGATPRKVDEPLPTVSTAGAISLCEPFLVECCHGNGKEGKRGDRRRVKSVDKPIGALHCSNKFALTEPFLIAIDHHGGNGNQVRSADAPLSTVSTKARHAVCEPFITQYYGSSDAQSVETPLSTVTTRDRFGLVMPTVIIDGERYLLDIRFRMLKSHELAAAQGFPKSYKFTGNTTQVVKQIGNAVPKNLAKAIVKAALTQCN